MTEEELIRKHNIIKMWDKRYYEIIMPNKTYALEYTNPEVLKLPDGSIIAENTWKYMYLKLVEWAISKGITKEQLLSIKYAGRLADDTHPFNDYESQKMMGKLSNGLYAIANWPGQLTFMAIQDFIVAIGLNLKDCHMLIYKSPYAEPAEVQKYYADQTVKQFNSWLLKRTTMEKATIIIKLLKEYTYLLKRVTPSNTSFFIFQSRLKYAQAKAKMLAVVDAELSGEQTKLKILKKSMDLLTDFYGELLPAK